MYTPQFSKATLWYGGWKPKERTQKKGIHCYATADKHVSDGLTSMLELYVCPSIRMHLLALLIMKGFGQNSVCCNLTTIFWNKCNGNLFKFVSKVYPAL